MIELKKLKHFYFNKYVVSLAAKRRYFISYDYCHRALWFRTYKVASRSIDYHLRDECAEGNYIYGSAMNYFPPAVSDYFKFAFVREPFDRFVSIWKGMVLKRNYFNFNRPTRQKMKNLDDFIEWVESKDFSNCDEHLIPQTSMIDFKHLDFLGRFESFDDDFAIVAAEIGLKKYKPKHLNPSPEKKIELSQEQKARIYKLYRKDFEVLYPEKKEVMRNIYWEDQLQFGI